MHETKEGFLEVCLTACMLWFIRSYYRTKEKAKTLQFQFWSKYSISTQRRFRASFKDETLPSRNTIIYLTVKYLIGWCVSIPHKLFSGRKKHVGTAEKARLIHMFVSNDPMKSHRRCGAPWAVGHHCCHQAGKWRRRGAPSCCRRMCPPFMQPLWPSSDCEAARVAVHRQRHLRHVVTKVSGPYPTSFPLMGSCEGRDLQAWTPRPLRAKNDGYGLCLGGDRSGVPQSFRRNAV